MSVLPDKVTPPAPQPRIAPVLAPDVFTFTPPSPGFPTVRAGRLLRPQVLGLALVPAIFWMALHDGDDDNTVSPLPPGPPEGPPTTVPEPGTPLLIGTGLAILLLTARRRTGVHSPVDQSLLR